MAHNTNNPGTNYPFLFPDEAITFDPEAFDVAVRSQGVQLKHWRGMRCPVGLLDEGDIRRSHPHHENCSNGMIYIEAGIITCLFTGVDKRTTSLDPGLADGSSSTVTMPRYYDDSPDTEVQIAPYDRFYLNESTITVPTWELVQANLAGADRLKFPVVRVSDLIDSNGIRYKQDVDFTIQNGQIIWGSKRPGTDPKHLTGTIYSCRYTYTPFWYCNRMLHEVRVAQLEDDFGNRYTHRFPQAMILQREYVFLNEDNTINNDSPRQVKGPESGSFGPR